MSNLSRRLTKVEQQLADKARRKELANCICRELTIALRAEEFEAEMSRTRPVHGFRHLGRVVPISFVNADRTVTEESVKTLQLLEGYTLRLLQNPAVEL